VFSSLMTMRTFEAAIQPKHQFVTVNLGSRAFDNASDGPAQPVFSTFGRFGYCGFCRAKASIAIEFVWSAICAVGVFLGAISRGAVQAIIKQDRSVRSIAGGCAFSTNRRTRTNYWLSPEPVRWTETRFDCGNGCARNLFRAALSGAIFSRNAYDHCGYGATCIQSGVAWRE